MSLPLPQSADPQALRDALAALVGMLERGYPVPNYTVASLPAATSVGAGTIVYVSDGGAGAQFRGSTGAAYVNLG